MSGRLDWESAKRRSEVSKRGSERVSHQGMVGPRWMTREQREELHDRFFPDSIMHRRCFTVGQANRLIATLRTIPVTRSAIDQAMRRPLPARRKALSVLQSALQNGQAACKQSIREVGQGPRAVPHVETWLKQAVEDMRRSLESARWAAK